MLSIGIVGLPNVGKSTLFKALTNKQTDIQNYPFTTIDPNVGVVQVPDERVDLLSEFAHSKKKVYTTVDFIDIAGLVKGAAQGEGLGNKFLANIREVDAIAQVVRAFDDSQITHVHNRVNPTEDIEIINTELILSDLETVSKRIEKTIKMANIDKKAKTDMAMLEKLKVQLEGGHLISSLAMNDDEILFAKELNLLTSKQFIYTINVSEDQLLNAWKPDSRLLEVMGKAPYVVMSNKLELTLSETSSLEEKKEFLKEFSLPESGLDRLIRQGYDALGLLTFLTTGEDETRAWTAHQGDPIPIAVRAIHTDFERLYIKADVINWQTLLDSGSYANARSKGLIRTVGREYIIQEGDVVEVKI